LVFHEREVVTGRRRKCTNGGRRHEEDGVRDRRERYIASALIKMLLEKGYAVKTTVRNPGLIL
jgi:hypothetical protein